MGHSRGPGRSGSGVVGVTDQAMKPTVAARIRRIDGFEESVLAPRTDDSDFHFNSYVPLRVVPKKDNGVGKQRLYTQKNRPARTRILDAATDKQEDPKKKK